MPETTGILSSLTQDTTLTGKNIYKAFVNGLELVTFAEPPYREALPLVGTQVTAHYKEVQKGEYLNRYLEKIVSSNGQTSTPTHELVTTPQSVVTKDQSIARAVALKAAVETLPHLEGPIDPAGVIQMAEFYEAWLTR